MNAVVSPTGFKDFVVADLSLADWGRREMAIAETEMPGLMAVREEFAASSITRPPGGISAAVTATTACSCARRRACSVAERRAKSWIFRKTTLAKSDAAIRKACRD